MYVTVRDLQSQQRLQLLTLLGREQADMPSQPVQLSQSLQFIVSTLCVSKINQKERRNSLSCLSFSVGWQEREGR